jgi:DNA-damage-inducible protein J
MAKTIQVRIDDEVKNAADALYSGLGLDISTAVRMFLYASLQEGGLPFEVKRQFNRETEEAMEEANAIANGRIESKSYSSAKELFEELDREIEA